MYISSHLTELGWTLTSLMALPRLSNYDDLDAVRRLFDGHVLTPDIGDGEMFDDGTTVFTFVRWIVEDLMILTLIVKDGPLSAYVDPDNDEGFPIDEPTGTYNFEDDVPF